jgi:hypothetical protein
VEWRFAQDGWRELDTSSRRSSEMAGYWRGLCPAVDCSRLMMMMMMIGTLKHKFGLKSRWRIGNGLRLIISGVSGIRVRELKQWWLPGDPVVGCAWAARVASRPPASRAPYAAYHRATAEVPLQQYRLFLEPLPRLLDLTIELAFPLTLTTMMAVRRSAWWFMARSPYV